MQSIFNYIVFIYSYNFIWLRFKIFNNIRFCSVVSNFRSRIFFFQLTNNRFCYNNITHSNSTFNSDTRNVFCLTYNLTNTIAIFIKVSITNHCRQNAFNFNTFVSFNRLFFYLCSCWHSNLLIKIF